MEKKKHQGLQHLNTLFTRYRTVLVAPQKTVINAFCDVVREQIGVTVKTSEVRYTPATRTLFLTTSAIVKNEVLQKKESLLLSIRERVGERGSPKHIL